MCSYIFRQSSWAIFNNMWTCIVRNIVPSSISPYYTDTHDIFVFIFANENAFMFTQFSLIANSILFSCQENWYTVYGFQWRFTSWKFTFPVHCVKITTKIYCESKNKTNDLLNQNTLKFKFKFRWTRLDNNSLLHSAISIQGSLMHAITIFAYEWLVLWKRNGWICISILISWTNLQNYCKSRSKWKKKYTMI